MPHIICNIFGARPQFVKAYAVSRALAGSGALHEIRVHSGQHYDRMMSQVFFEEFGLPEPDHNLGVGSGTHAVQTGRIMELAEKVLADTKPSAAIVYGDTNTTLAAALAAAKLDIPVAHVEAGMRCRDMRVPEEVNRVATDRISSLLFCPTESAAANLRAEGITTGVEVTGDVMVETFNMFLPVARRRSGILAANGLEPGKYLLLTVHRAENTDSPEKLESIFEGCSGAGVPVFFSAHPRTRNALREYGLRPPENVIVADPVSYTDMLAIESQASMVLTDSGGVQKEAYLAGVPCLTLRDRTEWVETVEAGWNFLVGADAEKIRRGISEFLPRGERENIFGPVDAASRIAAAIERFLKIS